MADLTSHSFYYCKSVENFSVKIGDYTVKHGRSGGQYVYDFSCTCKGFKFNKKCKHIEQAKSQYCGWDQFIDGIESVGSSCPKCCGEISFRFVAV
jgi:hypothetical protein